MSLQQLMEVTEYPPESSPSLINDTTKVVMVVDIVSPTPFALLRRAKNFEYRDDDYVLQRFSNYDDPIQALTDECRRVLKCISSTNQSAVSNSKTSTSLVDPSWSRFEDIGFSSTIEESDEDDATVPRRSHASGGLGTSPRSHNAEFGRPTTPSWADFLSSGFVDESGSKNTTPLLLPPDKILPPIKTTPRGHSSQSHRRPENENALEPGELASIDRLDLDDSFWWVWISSLAGEEPTSRKAAFGRCALIETVVAGGKWMILEEQVKGAAPEPTQGAYIAEKKGFFSTAKGRLTRRRSAAKKGPLSSEPYEKNGLDPTSRVTILPDQHARIQAAAAELSRKKRLENVQEQERTAARTETGADPYKSNRTSMMSLQPLIMTEASPAMKWATQYDKQVIRAQYLGDSLAGTGDGKMLTLPPDGMHGNGSALTLNSTRKERDLPPPPKEEAAVRETPPRAVPEPHRLVRDASPLPEQPAAQQVPPPSVLAPAPVPVAAAEIVHRQDGDRAADSPLPAQAQASEKAGMKAAPAEPAPPVRPSTPPRPHSRLRKKSIDVSPEQRKAKKKGPNKGPPPVKQPPTGFRQFFGTRRNKSKERNVEPASLSPAHPNPAIAAARAALEGRKQAPETDAAPPDSLEHLSRLRMTSASAAARAVPQRPLTPPASDRGESVTAPTQPDEPEIAQSGPKTRRDDEYDKLSRVDTNEREHADQEFSTFDQGPLADQPAFAPRDSYMPTPSPQPEAFFTPREEEPSHHEPASFYAAVTAPAPAPAAPEPEPEQAVNAEPAELINEVSPLDRWAQIRKNAAERAARQAEEQAGRPSHTETRTDDGETSGEESESGEPASRWVHVLTDSSNRISCSSHQGPCGRAHRQYGDPSTVMPLGGCLTRSFSALPQLSADADHPFTMFLCIPSPTQPAVFLSAALSLLFLSSKIPLCFALHVCTFKIPLQSVPVLSPLEEAESASFSPVAFVYRIPYSVIKESSSCNWQATHMRSVAQICLHSRLAR